MHEKRVTFYSSVFDNQYLNLRLKFLNPWLNYLAIRKIEKENQEPEFPDNYDFQQRDLFYSSIAGKKWAGSTGIDSVLIGKQLK